MGNGGRSPESGLHFESNERRLWHRFWVFWLGAPGGVRPAKQGSVRLEVSTSDGDSALVRRVSGHWTGDLSWRYQSTLRPIANAGLLQLT